MAKKSNHTNGKLVEPTEQAEQAEIQQIQSAAHGEEIPEFLLRENTPEVKERAAKIVQNAAERKIKNPPDKAQASAVALEVPPVHNQTEDTMKKTAAEKVTALKTLKAPAKLSKGKVIPLRKPNDNDAIIHKQLSRKNGATVAEMREATGWKGVIQKGPERVAKNAGKKLKWEGEGEARRFWFED